MRQSGGGICWCMVIVDGGGVVDEWVSEGGDSLRLFSIIVR